MLEVGERLKLLRLEKRLLQKNVADYLGYGSSAISNYEHGRNEPDISDLKKLATFFDVSIDYIVGTTNQKKDLSEIDYKSYLEFEKLYLSLDKHKQNTLETFSKYILSNHDKKAKF